MKLICLTFAGGSASFYNELKSALYPDIELIAFEYAGHGSRYKEPFYKDFDDLARDMLSLLKKSVGTCEDYALMGYSMGSIGVAELLKLILDDKYFKKPVHVFLAAHEPFIGHKLNDCQEGNADEYIKKRTVRFGGIPEKLVENKSFWRMYLPIYKADYQILDEYSFEHLKLQTDIPVTVFYSETDTPYESIKGWTRYFKEECNFISYEGNHFFIIKHCNEIAKEIKSKLTKMKLTHEDLLEISPYSLNKDEKEKLLTERLVELTEHHKNRCCEYARILDSISFDINKVKTYEDLPFLPVRLFKDFNLKSVSDDEVVKTMTSSGTTGQAVSKIYLDKITAGNQQKTMVKIVSEFTGTSRMPMVILDCPSVIKDRDKFSARGAGILGFSIFGSKKLYAFNDDMRLDAEELKKFLETYKEQTVFLFGFTFIIWQHFYKELIRLKEEGITFDFSNSILIHGGGWKKLVDESVSEEEFHKRMKMACGISRIHDYYGMVEQTGCIYMECECGHLHASIFSDVITRRHRDFSVCEYGEKGIIQVVSSIPESYPGHSLITEDEGVILGEDDCPCGRKGKYFKILGRLKNAEIRGCSDTYAAKF